MSPAPATALARLASLVGEENCLSDPGALAQCEASGVRPGAVVRPGTAEEVAEVVRFAAAEKLALIACGGRSKLSIGMPPLRDDVAVDVSRLNRVVAYDPGDLTLSVEAGIGIAPLLDALRERNQWLPLLVPWLQRATIGGILSSNSVSPLRYMFGGPRDFVLGVEFVTGDGKLCKSGSRVVKSVAGYDLHKLLLGALGTLGIITRVNFRTFPLPRAQRCFVATFQDASSAFDLCARIARSPLKPALVEMLDPGAARIVADEKVPADGWSVVIAAIGHEAVVERHARELAQLASESRASSFASLEDAEKQRLLERVREFVRLAGEQHPRAAIVRGSALPQELAGSCDSLARAATANGCRCAIVVRAVSTVYAVLIPGDGGEPGLEAALRSALDASRSGAHAWIEHCPAEMKQRINVWGPVRADFALMKQVKQVFDPHGILSPGRFAGGL